MRKEPIRRYRAAQHRAHLMLKGLGQALKRRRMSLGLSQEIIAGQIDMPASRIEMMELGTPRPAQDYCALAAALDSHLELVEVNHRGR